MLFDHTCPTPEILIRLYSRGGLSSYSMLKYIRSSDENGYYLDPKFWKEVKKTIKNSLKK